MGYTLDFSADKEQPKLVMDWYEVDRAADKIAKDILESDFLKPNMPACIVPLVRGGMPLGTILSHKLNGLPVFPLQFQSRDYKNGHRIREVGRMRLLMNRYKNLLVVDDIIDTGETMHELNIYANDLLDEDQSIAIATICTRAEFDDYKWSGFSHQFTSFYLMPDVSWIVFPWEAKSLVTDVRSEKEKIKNKELRQNLNFKPKNEKRFKSK